MNGQTAVNIGPGERRKRLIFGLISWGVGILLALALIASGASRWWRLVLALPFWLGALGVFQAREKT